jgi:anti-sigma factor RsiW
MNQPTQTTQTTSNTEHLTPATLSAYIDGELPPSEHHAVQQHLTTCHACTLRALSATQLKDATARAGHRFAPPPEALARLTANLDAQQHPNQQQTNQERTKKQQTTEQLPKQPAKIYSIRPMTWAALAAAILLTVSLLGWRTLHQTNTLAAELLDQHLATLSSGATPQVISTDRHTVKPWFQGRLPFSFNLPDTEVLPPDTTLKGADLAFIDGQPTALLLFAIHKHEVSIFLTQRANSLTLTALPKTHAGFTIRTATTSDLRIIAVSDVNPADLDLLVASLVRVQASH